jgi:uncharacterized membrane protein YfcA
MNAILIGFIGGSLSSFIGIGAGSIYVPILVIMLGFSPFMAQAFSLGIIFPVSLFSGFLYSKKGFVSTPHILSMLPWALVSVLVGTAIAYFLPAVFLKKLFGIILFYVAIKSWKN